MKKTANKLNKKKTKIYVENLSSYQQLEAYINLSTQ